MKIKSRKLLRFGGFALSQGLLGVMSTLDVRLTHYDRSVDPALPEYQSGAIYIFWHECISFPFAMWNRYDMVLLVSQHRDAEILRAASDFMGFRMVRGSTNRGGVSALRELKRIGKSFDISITPDGPRGPRRSMATGAVFLSSRLGIPLVPVGFGYDRPIRVNTWDRFAIPRPFTRARAIMGPRIEVERKAKRDELENCRAKVELMLNDLTDAAEDWATSGKRMQGEVPFVRIRKPERILEKFGASPLKESCPVDRFQGHGTVDRRTSVRQAA